LNGRWGSIKSDVVVVVASETGRNVELENLTIGLLFITYTFFLEEALVEQPLVSTLA